MVLESWIKITEKDFLNSEELIKKNQGYLKKMISRKTYNQNVKILDLFYSAGMVDDDIARGLVTVKVRVTAFRVPRIFNKRIYKRRRLFRYRLN